MPFFKHLNAFLFLSILLFACSSSENAGIKTAKIPLAEAETQDANQTLIDPLFEIEGQICQHLRRILQDSKGDLWLGTNVYGLLKYDGDSLSYISDNEGLETGRITAIVEDSLGNIWIGSYFGLIKYDGISFKNYSKKDGLIDSEIWCITIDSQGLLWIGTMEGVSTFDGYKFANFTVPTAHISKPEPILSSTRICSITEDSHGNMWFATDGHGVSIYDRKAHETGAFKFLTKDNGLCDNNITSILEDRNGKIWFGSMYGGVSRYDPKSSLPANEKAFENFTLDSVVAGIEVWSVFEDKAGNIWFPAENYGVYRYNEEGFTNFATEDGLASLAIQCIYEDREGRIWLGGWLGLFRYDPQPLKKGGQKPFYSVAKTGPWD